MASNYGFFATTKRIDFHVTRLSGIYFVSAVGAGDTFTAALANGVLRGLKLDEINARANQIGAFAVSQKGAMRDFPTSERQKLSTEN